MNHDLTLDRRAFALWASADLGAHIDIDGSLGAQRGDTLTMRRETPGMLASAVERGAPQPEPLRFEVTFVARLSFEHATEHGVVTVAGPDLLHVRPAS